jgi:D-alanyl-D-alanine carboxypeptidase
MNLQRWRFLCLITLFITLFGCGGKGDEQGSNSLSVSSNLISASVTSSTSSSNASSTPNTSDLAQKIDTYLTTNQALDLPGVSVLIVKNGKLAYSGSRGMADITANAPISEHTGFRLASVSKPFTAVAILQLVEKGQLNLLDSVLDYIPELPSSWRNITLAQLLSHRSGIYDIINDGWRPTVLNGMTNYSLLNYLIKNPALEFVPNTQSDYSNTGYMLLATVIERKTGLSFSDYMAINVFGPANMTGSYINDEKQPIKTGDALNYARLRTYYGIATNLKGSMAQVSSVEDFFNFFAALRNGTLISAQTLATMMVARGTLKGTNIEYGYGFAIQGNTFKHSGEWDGFMTQMVIDRGAGIEYVILTNSGSAGWQKIIGIEHIILTTLF